VLENTTPTTTAAGAPGKAKYLLADGVAASTREASAEMLSANPLYPGLEL
jgi:glycine hydroxymethyltransferase